MVVLTNSQLRELYFDIIISKYTTKAIYKHVLEDFENLGRYIHAELLELAYYDAMKFLEDFK